MTQPSREELLATARSRIAAMKIAPCSGLASSKKAAEEFEVALDLLERAGSAQAPPRLRIWHHGTNREASQIISEQGFAPGSWFAESLEDAIEFGGPYVFEVMLHHRPLKDGAWQMKIGDAIPATAIVSLTEFKPTKLFDHPDRRAVVLAATKAACTTPSTVAALPASSGEVREAIEECARVCDRWIASKNLHEHMAATDIAASIRALKSSPSVAVQPVGVPTIPVPLWAVEDLLKWMPKVRENRDAFYPIGLENLMRALIASTVSSTHQPEVK